MVTKICAAAFLFIMLCSSAHAAQLGRTTGEVNFRERPSRSAPIIGRLPAGTDVQILQRDPTGWYLVNVRGRQGFVYRTYLKASQPAQWPKGRKHLGVILIFIGFMLIIHYFFPFVSKTAMLVIGSFVLVAVVDLVFDVGILYSFFAVVSGLLGAVTYLTYRKESRQTAVHEKPQRLKKAA